MPWPATRARCCATRTSATPASPATATAIVVRFRDPQTRGDGADVLSDQLPDVAVARQRRRHRLQAHRQPQARRRQAGAVGGDHAEHHHACTTASTSSAWPEPVIQQQGADRVVGAAARGAGHGQGQGHHRPHRDPRDAHGRRQPRGPLRRRAAPGRCRSAARSYVERSGAPVIVKRQVIVTGESLTDAQPGFDGQTHEPAVHLTMDARARASCATSRARTSASGWRSCCSRRARARS